MCESQLRDKISRRYPKPKIAVLKPSATGGTAVRFPFVLFIRLLCPFDDLNLASAQFTDAARAGNLKEVLRLLDAGASINEQDGLFVPQINPFFPLPVAFECSEIGRLGRRTAVGFECAFNITIPPYHSPTTSTAPRCARPRIYVFFSSVFVIT